MDPMHRHCENAHIIFGAVIDESFAGKLSVTLIASSRRADEEPSTGPRQGEGGSAPSGSAGRESLEAMQFLDQSKEERPASRFVPPPNLSTEKKEQLMRGHPSRSRKALSKLQKELPLEIIYKGRFEKSDPTIRNGEDLDVPTYVRRGVSLN